MLVLRTLEWLWLFEQLQALMLSLVNKALICLKSANVFLLWKDMFILLVLRRFEELDLRFLVSLSRSLVTFLADF